MKAVYFDQIGGSSGNMLLGALIDAGAPVAELETALRSIPISGWTLEQTRVLKRGVAATYFDFIIPGEDGHPGAAAHGRHLDEVLGIVARSGLSASQKARASAIYQRLGEAEARVHGTTVDQVHFHEVGAVDAILDVAGTCVALDLLGIERVYASAYPLGNGEIVMQHGRFPNPPPATADLMRGAATRSTDVTGELVTPTAAAILATLVARVGERPSMTFERHGYGAGRSDFPMPNVVRATIGELAESSATTVRVLEANVDDLSPEYFELAIERVFAAGALDVWLSPITMKKARPAVLFSAIVPVDRAAACADAILMQTSTIGVRSYDVERYVAERAIEERETPYGPVRVKTATIAGHARSTLEYDDLLRIARERNRPLADLARELERILDL
jgi:uncharacterized protein (TIGR00299 family) protein